jgi:hypothetical protein
MATEKGKEIGRERVIESRIVTTEPTAFATVSEATIMGAKGANSETGMLVVRQENMRTIAIRGTTETIAIPNIADPLVARGEPMPTSTKSEETMIATMEVVGGAIVLHVGQTQIVIETGDDRGLFESGAGRLDWILVFTLNSSLGRRFRHASCVFATRVNHAIKFVEPQATERASLF